MWPRLRLDVSWSDLAMGLVGCRSRSRRSVESPFGEQLLTCLSARSGFDLLLQTLRLPSGSHVLFSAMTVPDMARIAHHHQLVAVPVDLNPADYGPSITSLERVISPRAKVLVLAHLFGRVSPAAQLVELARSHGLIIVEDFAQAFRGPASLMRFEGDAALFSFGPIKLNTALRGGLFATHDATLTERMRRLQESYPSQSHWCYRQRLLKCCLSKIALQRSCFGAINHGSRAVGLDIDRALQLWAQNFSGDFAIENFRQRPNELLTQMLRRRLQRFDCRTAQRRTACANDIAARLKLARFDAGWLVPVIVGEPVAALAALRANGIDAATAARLSVIEPPAEHPEWEASMARTLLRQTILLPVHPDMPSEVRAKMCAAVAPFMRTSTDDAPRYEALGALCRSLQA